MRLDGASRQPHSSVWGFPQPANPRRMRRSVFLVAPHLERCGGAEHRADPQFGVGIPNSQHASPFIDAPHHERCGWSRSSRQPHSSVWGIPIANKLRRLSTPHILKDAVEQNVAPAQQFSVGFPQAPTTATRDTINPDRSSAPTPARACNPDDSGGSAPGYGCTGGPCPAHQGRPRRIESA